MVEDGMELLSIPECQRLLQAGGVGIIALCGSAAPVLRPVNFVVFEEWILIRTGEGRILEAAQRAEFAAFAISEIDRLEHAGWSVIVTGKLAERSRIEALSDLPLRPWARAEKAHFVALSLDELSGRRIAQGVEGA